MVRLLPVNYTSAVDKLIEYIPDLMEKANTILNKTIDLKNTDTTKTPQEKTNEIKKKQKIKKDNDIQIEYDETDNDLKDDEYIEEDE